MITADAIIEAHRNTVAAETAEVRADIARLEDEVRAANGALHAAENRLTAIVQRRNAELYRDLHVKVDPLTGEPMARPGRKPGRGEAQEPPLVIEPPPSTATPETPTTGDGADAGDVSSAGEVPIGGASGLGALFEADTSPWETADLGAVRGHLITALGWTANDLVVAALPNWAMRTVAKHSCTADEYTQLDSDVVVIGSARYTLAMPARVVA